MPRPWTLAAAAAAALLLLLAGGPSPAGAGLFRNVKLTEKQEGTVRKVDELLNQFLENIRRMFYKKNPHLKPYPHEGFAYKDYSIETIANQDLNPGTGSPVEGPLHTNISKEQEEIDAQKGMDPGRDRQDPPAANEKGSNSADEGADGRVEPPVASDGECGQGFSGNAMCFFEYDDSKIRFPDD
ncbi:uncharacterized protein LOC125043941 [Penaeus chinensis]|uniref:uncharacterized protein LOC125043941 n=1 Tax=Penaeus chinensis TaxID=139456 RepID=UPI001FB7623C|nr:uncharacterized protein LOC125043941 [Penaeus chinensis]